MSTSTKKKPMSRKRPPAKQKADPLQTRAETLRYLSERFDSAKRHVMGIDQAFDKSGVAFFFPRLPKDELMDYFVESYLCRIDSRFSGRSMEMKSELRRVIKNGGGALEIAPRAPKRLPLGFGSVLGKEGGFSICFHAVVEFAPCDEPEWKQGRDVSKKLNEIASVFVKLAQASGDKKPSLAIEGMALRGSINTIAVLPCLGILYGRVWETFQDNPVTCDLMQELPIGQWKKLFTGSGRADKKMIKSMCTDLGFGRMETDDESDAIGLTLVKALFDDSEAGKSTGGRLRPTRMERKAQRDKRAKKKQKKAAKLELNT